MRKLYVEDETMLRACLADPPNCKRDELLARFDDPARTDIAQLVDGAVSSGIHRRSPGPDKDYFVIEGDIPVGKDLAVATVESCTYDARVQFKPAPAGGTETVVDARASSYRQAWDFIRAPDGTWHAGAITLLDNFTWKDKNVCPPPNG